MGGALVRNTRPLGRPRLCVVVQELRAILPSGVHGARTPSDVARATPLVGRGSATTASVCASENGPSVVLPRPDLRYRSGGRARRAKDSKSVDEGAGFSQKSLQRPMWLGVSVGVGGGEGLAQPVAQPAFARGVLRLTCHLGFCLKLIRHGVTAKSPLAWDFCRAIPIFGRRVNRRRSKW